MIDRCCTDIFVQEVKRILYGANGGLPVAALKLPVETVAAAQEQNYDLQVCVPLSFLHCPCFLPISTRKFLANVLFAVKRIGICDSPWQAYKFVAAAEQLRAPRIVRVGVIQNATVLPTDAPYAEQRDAIMRRVGTMIDAAAAAGVNILCLQVKGGNEDVLSLILSLCNRP